MIGYALASLALFGASVSASSQCGSAQVINSCSYEIYMQNTPSSGGGYSEIDKTLQPGDTYEQEYTALSNGNGWSMKLSKVQGAYASNILQYEYTYQNEGTIWFDLSCVNGDPLAGDWHISASPATNGCNPGQAPYMYPTEDRVVPEVSQSCTSDNSIVVTLCSSNGNSTSSSGSGSGSSSGGLGGLVNSIVSEVLPGSSATSAQSSQATPTEAASSQEASSQAASTPASSSEAPAALAVPASFPSAPVAEKEAVPAEKQYDWNNADASRSEAAEVSPTTFATVTTSGPPEVIVTDVQTAVVTNFVTAYAGRVKPRHEHHARGHQHNA